MVSDHHIYSVWTIPLAYSPRVVNAACIIKIGFPFVFPVLVRSEKCGKSVSLTSNSPPLRLPSTTVMLFVVVR